MIDLPPVPKLWLPPKPAIIRATEMPRDDLQQCAFAPGFKSGPSGPPTSLTLAASANATTTSITMPAGAQTGDVAVLFDGNAGTVTAVTPSGWTLISRNTTIATMTTNLSYKILTAGDLGASVTGMVSTSGSGRKQLLVFRGNTRASAVSVNSVNSQGTTGDPTSQTITASTGPAPLVVIGYAHDLDGVDPSPTGTLATTGTIVPPAFVGACSAYRIFNSSPANLTWDTADTGTATVIQSAYLSIS